MMCEQQQKQSSSGPDWVTGAVLVLADAMRNWPSRIISCSLLQRPGTEMSTAVQSRKRTTTYFCQMEPCTRDILTSEEGKVHSRCRKVQNYLGPQPGFFPPTKSDRRRKMVTGGMFRPGCVPTTLPSRI